MIEKVSPQNCSRGGPSSEAHYRSYMLSTQLQVLMWDTLNGKVEQKELDAGEGGRRLCQAVSNHRPK